VQPTPQRARLFAVSGLLWLGMTLVAIAYATRLALFVSPTDAAQGNIGRNIYYHVPIAMLSLIFPYINLVASLAYLYWRSRDPLKALTSDAWAISSAEVTVVYASICLLTGSIWGRVAWGIWWTWDARLTSMLLLWLLYVSYLMLRKFSSTGQSQTLAAVLSVFAAIDVPIVYMSITWWRTQHPAPVFGGGERAGIAASMQAPVWWNVFAWVAWGTLIVSFRYTVELRRQEIDSAKGLELINERAVLHHERDGGYGIWIMGEQGYPNRKHLGHRAGWADRRTALVCQ
jgi:heme exporter protein C